MANKSMWQGETSYDQICSSSSSVHPGFGVCSEEYHKLSLCTDQIIETSKGHDSQNKPLKWTPSRMKLMQKMTHEPDQGPEKNPLTCKFQNARPDDQYLETNTGETSSLTVSSNKSRSSSLPAVRVCSDCSTSTTPLWRSGPRGPKSLCNACGIRQRKAWRSMDEASGASVTGCGSAMATTTARSSTMNKGKEKKSQQNHNVDVTVSCKKKGKLIMTDDITNTSESKKHLKRNDK